MNGTTCFVDLETGGLEPHHPTIQVAVVAIDHAWNELETIEIKLRFDPGACDYGALELNSYEPEVWEREAVDVAHAQVDLQRFFGRHQTWNLVSKAGNAYRTARIAGHNAASFDAPRLKAVWNGSFCPFAWWYPTDTLQLALWHFARAVGERRDHRTPPRNYQLGTLCEYFGIASTGAHDALADARMTVRLARRLLEGW